MNINDIVSELNTLGIDERLTVEQRTAVNEALMQMMRLRRREDDTTDFQGWPVRKLTMRDIRDFVSVSDEVPDDARVLVLEDDGMGYGANNGYCSEIYTSNRNGDETVYIWF